MQLVFKRRGISGHSSIDSASSSNPESILKRIEVVMDVSGSMYRFNGQDQRLERMLETALMIMEAFSSSSDDTDGSGDPGVLQYAMSGHSGDSSYIPFLKYGQGTSNEGERMAILQQMIAHSQFCSSGDNTVEAIREAVGRVADSVKGVSTSSQRFVIVVSDANFNRYGISTSTIKSAMTHDPRVKVFLVLIASMGDEAGKVAKQLPEGHCFVCDGSSGTDIVGVFKDILMASGGVLDVSAL